MVVIVNDIKYFYVDTICVDEIVYDVYENEVGEVFYKIIDSIF